MRKIPWLVAGLLSGVCVPALGQHETAFDLVGGEQAFQQYCANCHGRAGNMVAGVDLGRARFRRSYTDAELADVILNGIPDTPMPATPGMSPEQAVEIVTWLRSLGMQEDVAAGGDVSRGRVLFTGKGQCLACHRVQGEGSRVGPELSRIGLLRTAAELAASVLYPAAEVQPQNRFYGVTTDGGERVEGRLLNHDAFTVQLLDTEERLRSFDKALLREHGFLPSPMPSLQGEVDDGELADLVQYLVSLRGEPTP